MTKEERNTGKTHMEALDVRFKKALVIILDSHITTLIAGLGLFYLAQVLLEDLTLLCQ